MSGVITTGSFPKLLWPGLNKIWGMTYQEWENGAEWKQIFEIAKSDKNYEEDVGVTGLAMAPIKNEGDSVQYDTMKQGFVSRYQNITYALGFIISQEEIEDCQYAQMGAQRTRSLAFSMHQTREHVAANILNRAFNSSYKGGDGVSLVNSLHPIENGTFSNTTAFPSDLSEAALEQAAIDIWGFVDPRGNRISILPNKLLVPRQLIFEATRILKNERWRPDTANRDINAMAVLNTFSGGLIANHYLIDPDAWFVLTNCPNGLRCFDRVATEFANDNDFDTTNMKYRARARYAYGWTDPRGLYGSAGA